mgnify:CR=1 FL=1
MVNDLLLLFFGFCLICLYYWYFTNEKLSSGENSEIFEMEEVFLNEVSHGEKSCRIAFIYSISDLIILKSLLQSEQIPFICEFEHLAKIKTGLPIAQVNNIILNVLERDIPDSLFILNEFKKTKPVDRSLQTKIRSIIEFILLSNSVPSSKSNNLSILIKDQSQFNTKK